jgi:MFS family permease
VRDVQLRRFIVTRALLMATALAPPYLLQLAGRGDGAPALGQLGPFVVASSLAAMLSSYVWGRLSDRSSRRVLILAAGVAALALAGTAVLALVVPASVRAPFVLPALLFVLMIAYQGVRVGRSTHIVDMATESTRAVYTALANTVIGVLLLLAGTFGLLAQAVGPVVVLAVFAAMCLLAALQAVGLREVQR